MSIRRIKLVLCIFIPFFSFFLMSHNIFAASLQTSSFDLYYRVNNNSSYGWRNNIIYGNNSPTIIDSGGGITRYQFNTPSVQAGGNYATIHFETNIVASAYVLIHNFNPWVNLAQQNILTCSASGIAVVSKNLSYATTYWTDQYNESNNTLTFYGDVVLSGFNPGSNYSLTCSIGSASFSFINFNGGGVWFEQNPMSIVWSNDESIALMNTQIEQQNTIINQNETIINNQNQNTEDIINNQNQNADDIIKSNQRCYENLLNVTVTSFANSNGLSLTLNNDKSITLNGTNNSSNTRYLRIGQDFTLPAGTYTLSNGNSQVSVSYVIFYDDNHNFGSSAYTNNYTSTFNSSVTIKPYLRVAPGSSFSNFTIYPQINKGDKALSFIPYGEEKCTNFTQEYNDKQSEAWDNIGGQNAADINGATNQQTTNLIGTISSFVSALSSINTNGSCQLTLPFPSLLGGNQVVNPCNGADKAPSIITAASSLLLITVFVPLAFLLVKMIYNEIRSFTNG